MPKQRLHRHGRLKPGNDDQRAEADDALRLAFDRRDASVLGAAAILRLQRSLGNQAVQRLVIQRQPNDAVEADSSKAIDVPRIVATITLLSGKVEGSVRAAGHEGKIAIESINFDVTRVGTGRREPREGPPQLVQVTITKRRDSASPILARAAAKGERVESAQFEYLKRNDDGTISARLMLDLTGGYVTSHSGSGEFETLTIEFEGQKDTSESDRPEKETY
jgi:type VI protein secretion system component Hcp